MLAAPTTDARLLLVVGVLLRLHLRQDPSSCRRRPATPGSGGGQPAGERVGARAVPRAGAVLEHAGIGGDRPDAAAAAAGMERSYSANVRVDPVINVFGFGQLFMPSSPAKQEKKADRDGTGRRSRPEKLAMVLRDPQD